MKIERDKYYRTREGKKARVICTDKDDGDYPVVCIIECLEVFTSTVIMYIKDGRFYYNKTSSRDLVAEWVDEPEGSWDGYPAWAPWRAMDANGGWWCYVKEPLTQYEEGKWGSSFESLQIPDKYAPKYSGDWKDSLQKRPTGEK